VAYFNSLGSAPPPPPRTVSSGLSSSNAFYSRPRTVSLLGTFHLCMNIRGPPEREKSERERARAHAENGRSPFRLVLPSSFSPCLAIQGAPWFKSTIKPRPLNIYEPGSHNMSARARPSSCYFVQTSGDNAGHACAELSPVRGESELKITRRWSLWWDSPALCAPGYPFLSPHRRRFFLFLSLFFFYFLIAVRVKHRATESNAKVFAHISYTNM